MQVVTDENQTHAAAAEVSVCEADALPSEPLQRGIARTRIILSQNYLCLSCGKTPLSSS